MARLSFNAHEVEDNGDGGGGGGGFQALSTGEYTCVVHDTDIRRTKKGDGSYLLIVWEVVEGLFKAFAKAIDFACQRDPRITGKIPSTKGRLIK